MLLTPAGAAAAVLAAGLLLVVARALPPLLHDGRWAWVRPRAALAGWLCWVLSCVLAPVAALLGACSVVLQLTSALTGPGSSAPGVAALSCASVAAALGAAVVGRAAVLALGLVRRRRRHAAVVELVGTWDPRWEVLVVPSAVPAAYALAASPPTAVRDPAGPGAASPRATVVLTTAAMSITDDAERSVIIAHHQARSAWYLDAVVLLFTLWHDLLHRWRATRTASDDVATLVAMVADRAPARAVGVDAAIGALRRLESGLPGGCDEEEWTPRPATVRRVRHLLRAGGRTASVDR